MLLWGNHDIWAKKSNEITSIDSLKWIPNVQIYTDCQTYKWHNKEILLMPWRRDSNHETETLANHPSTNSSLLPFRSRRRVKFKF